MRRFNGIAVFVACALAMWLPGVGIWPAAALALTGGVCLEAAFRPTSGNMVLIMLGIAIVAAADAFILGYSEPSLIVAAGALLALMFVVWCAALDRNPRRQVSPT